MGSEEEKDTILSILVSLLVAHKHGTTLSNLACKSVVACHVLYAQVL